MVGLLEREKNKVNSQEKECVKACYFNMWRAVFAMAHADKRIVRQEIRFMAEVIETLPFDESQKSILKDDAKNPKDPREMFFRIKTQKYQELFFQFAQDMVWIDGLYALEEKDEMASIVREHIMHLKMGAVESLRLFESDHIFTGDRNNPRHVFEDLYDRITAHA